MVGFGFCAWACIATALCPVLDCITGETPLPEHPRPDLERPCWMNLNGEWKFAFDAADKGECEKWQTAQDDKFDRRITVPFPWGCKLSGVGNEADTAWYRRNVTVPEAWKGMRVFLVVGASDHDTSCWFAGKWMGEHSGGYTPFEFELTDAVEWGKAQPITFRVWDMPAKDADRNWRLFGKQGYGNVRGIWQTVYLEARSADYIRCLRFIPNVDASSVAAEVLLGAPASAPLSFEIGFKPCDRGAPACVAIIGGEISARLEIPLPRTRLWSLEDPYLYEVKAVLRSHDAMDEVSTYFGMRKVSIGKTPTGHPYVMLNNKPIYLQMALDQSYNQNGYYTYPSDEAMKRDILISKGLALSGNRVHIKAEVPRKLYWADRLGLLVMADVPCAFGSVREAMFREHWRCFEGMLERDFNHPCIFSWVLFNETWGLFRDEGEWGRNRARRYSDAARREVAYAYAKAKALDPTRLVEDNSPCERDHVVTDLNTWHTYAPGYAWEGVVAEFCTNAYPGSSHNFASGFRQGDVPLLNSEFGNVWGYTGSTGDCDWSWDYHMAMNAFRRNLKCAGWLYTEHHDVINEWNGYVRYDRSPKYTGIEELFPGMTLADLHGDAYLPLDVELGREFAAGETWTVPVDISLATDKFAGRVLRLEYHVRGSDWRGSQFKTAPVSVGEYKASAWQNGRLADVPVRLPDATTCGTICFVLYDGLRPVGRNFVCFSTFGNFPSGVKALRPTQVSASCGWAKKWDVMDGLKLCCAGHGSIEYDFEDVPEGRSATFRAELSSKRLNAKDFGGVDSGDIDLTYMLGGGHMDRAKNANSYPMTSDDKWPAAARVYANGELVKAVVLPDDPADHRGVLSWIAQRRDRRLRDAGSYGYLVEAVIPASIVAKGRGRIVVRLEADKGGLAVYGGKFGRFPTDPHIEFQSVEY